MYKAANNFIKHSMKKLPVLSFQHKSMLALLLLINLTFIITWFMGKGLTESTVLKEKESKLMALARIMDFRLEPGGFKEILLRYGAQNAPREQKIQILREVLSPIADEVGASSPGLGVGYYDLDLDAIVAYAPSKDFGQAVGRTIPQNHPGRTVMREYKEMAASGSMVRGDILNAMHPIERDGEVVGYTWANELKTDITHQINAMGRDLFFIMLICCFIACGLIFFIARRTVRDVDRIISSVRAMRFDLNLRIEPGEGELGEVANSINYMAEGISRANEERVRAVSVLQSVMSNVESVIYVCDPHTKTLIYANDYLRKIMNNSDLTGKLCHEVLQGRSEPCPFCPQKQLFDENGGPVFTPLRWEFHNELAQRDFLVMDRLINWHDGRLLHMEVGTDITERKALAMAEAANNAQREFMARMSHEIRTPMSGVLGMTHLAIQANPAPVQLEYLKKIQSSASLLLGIINDILDYSRIESGKFKMEQAPFNIRELLESIKDLILPGMKEKNLEFRSAIDASVPETVVGDALRLSQIMLNLLGNASKFTMKGHVCISLRAEPLAPGRINLFCRVEDSGIGISEEERKKLFAPFAQADDSTSRKFGGTGLGLSISKTMVEMMGGEIGVESLPGEGSSFFFNVGLALIQEGEALKGAVEKKPWEGANYNGREILLVEDNNINQEIVLAILDHLGIKADLAENGEEAVESFMSKDYSLILMDVRMPVMDGIEATKRIRSSSKPSADAIPIIAMTANVMEEDRKAGKNAGMSDYLAKPIDLEEFQKALYRWMGSSGPVQ